MTATNRLHALADAHLAAQAISVTVLALVLVGLMMEAYVADIEVLGLIACMFALGASGAAGVLADDQHIREMVASASLAVGFFSALHLPFLGTERVWPAISTLIGLAWIAWLAWDIFRDGYEQQLEAERGGNA